MVAKRPRGKEKIRKDTNKVNTMQTPMESSLNSNKSKINGTQKTPLLSENLHNQRLTQQTNYQTIMPTMQQIYQQWAFNNPQHINNGLTSNQLTSQPFQNTVSQQPNPQNAYVNFLSQRTNNLITPPPPVRNQLASQSSQITALLRSHNIPYHMPKKGTIIDPDYSYYPV